MPYSCTRHLVPNVAAVKDPHLVTCLLGPIMDTGLEVHIKRLKRNNGDVGMYRLAPR